MEARASAAANVTRCRFGIGSSRLMGTMRRITVGDPRRGAQIDSILTGPGNPSQELDQPVSEGLTA